MTHTEIKAALARQSTAALFDLRKRWMGISTTAPASKATLVDMLADHLQRNPQDIPAQWQINAAPAPAAPAAPNPTAAAALQNQINDQAGVIRGLGAQVNVIAADTQNISAGLNAVDARMNRVEAALIQMDGKLTDAMSVSEKALRHQAAAVSQETVNAAIAAAVRAGFDSFKTQVQAEGAEATVVAHAAATPAWRESALTLFGVDVRDASGNPLEFDVWADPAAPAIDTDFLWTEGIIRALAGGAAAGLNIWLGGDKGVGKSDTCRQFAARTGRAFTRINFQKYTEGADFIGGTGLVNGATQFVPGDFLTAFTHPGAVILLDEISNCQPGALAVINGLLESNARQTIGGQVWTRSPGVMVFGADNTLGTGDESGQYAGTQQMNTATLDRFGLVYHMTWLPPDVEARAITQRTGCDLMLAQKVVGVLSACRAKVDAGDIVSAPSIRSAMAFCQLLPVMGADAAWDCAIANRQPSESAAALAAIKAAFLQNI